MKKEQIFIIIATDTICSCIEFADELFQHTLGHECMEDVVNTISIYVYTTRLKKKATPFLFVMIIKYLWVISLFF